MENIIKNCNDIFNKALDKQEQELTTNTKIKTVKLGDITASISLDTKTVYLTAEYLELDPLVIQLDDLHELFKKLDFIAFNYDLDEGLGEPENIIQ